MKIFCLNGTVKLYIKLTQGLPEETRQDFINHFIVIVIIIIMKDSSVKVEVKENWTFVNAEGLSKMKSFN